MDRAVYLGPLSRIIGGYSPNLGDWSVESKQILLRAKFVSSDYSLDEGRVYFHPRVGMGSQSP